MKNFGDVVHGGVVAMILNLFSTVSICSMDKDIKLTSTLDLSCNYIKGLTID